MRYVNRLIQKSKRLGRYFRLFNWPSDLVKYYRCRHWPYLDDDVELSPKQISHSVICRPRTSDAAVLWGTFGEKLHRPPVGLPSDAVILDLGANVGYTAVDLANLYPSARVIAVEMDGDNAEIARRNLQRFGARCDVVHSAVWPSEGIVSYEGNEEWGYRVIPNPSPGDGLRTAPAITMSVLLSSFEIKQVDYLKMDIEGAEGELLSHPATWLDAVRSLKVEVHPPASVSRCAAALIGHGFDVSVDDRRTAMLIAIHS